MDRQYIGSLDGVRALAFLLVFFSHSGYELVPGGIGVTIFFFLSGYLITSLLRKEHVRNGEISLAHFYRRRACRILPPLYCVLILTTLLDRFGIPSRELNTGGLLSVLFYYFNYGVLLFGRSTIHVANGMGVVWSLMVEEHFYILFPVLYVAMLRKRLSARSQSLLLTLTCLAVLVWRVILVFGVHIDLNAREVWTYSATDARFDSILWGCILAIYANPWCGDEVTVLNRYKAQLAMAGAGLLLLTFLVREPHFRETIRYSLQGIALLPLFYYLIASPTSWTSRILECAPLHWLGMASYTMYLVHYFTLDVFERYLPLHPIMGMLLAFAACGIFSEGIRRFVEIPFRRFGRLGHLSSLH